MADIKILEREVELLKEMLELKEKLLAIEKQMWKNVEIVPYPVYSTFPQYPYFPGTWIATSANNTNNATTNGVYYF